MAIRWDGVKIKGGEATIGILKDVMDLGPLCMSYGVPRWLLAKHGSHSPSLSDRILELYILTWMTPKKNKAYYQFW